MTTPAQQAVAAVLAEIRQRRTTLLVGVICLIVGLVCGSRGRRPVLSTADAARLAALRADSARNADTWARWRATTDSLDRLGRLSQARDTIRIPQIVKIRARADSLATVAADTGWRAAALAYKEEADSLTIEAADLRVGLEASLRATTALRTADSVSQEQTRQLWSVNQSLATALQKAQHPGRWHLGAYGGYGATFARGTVYAGPQLGAGVTFDIRLRL